MDHILPGLHTLIENFYLCSHLPVAAFIDDITEVALTGYTAHNSNILNQYFSNAMIKELFNKLDTQCYTHYSHANGISLSVFQIKHPEKPIYLVIGPYTTEHTHRELLPYKPLFSMDTLMHLLMHLSQHHFALPSPKGHPAVSHIYKTSIEYTASIESSIMKADQTSIVPITLDHPSDIDLVNATTISSQTPSAHSKEAMPQNHSEFMQMQDALSSETSSIPSDIEHSLTKNTSLTDVTEEQNYHVIKAKRYIETHYKEAITLNQLTEYLGINKSYFCTIFKKATKHSYCTYLNHVRIEKSKHLLCHTNASILDIALEIGYNSASYYSNMFKKLVGQTPLAYRTEHLMTQDLQD